MPTLAASYFVVTSAVDTSTLTTVSFSPAAGEIIVVKAGTWDSTDTMSTPTATGLTFTQRVASTSGGFRTWDAIFTATVASAPGSITVSSTPSASSWHNMLVERWTSASLAATPVTHSTNNVGTPSDSLTTSAANSVISWTIGDAQSVNPSTRAYLNSATEENIDDQHSATNGVWYYAYQNVVTAGSTSYGLSLPTGQQYWIMGIEILDNSAPPVSDPGFPFGNDPLFGAVSPSGFWLPWPTIDPGTQTVTVSPFDDVTATTVGYDATITAAATPADATASVTGFDATAAVGPTPADAAVATTGYDATTALTATPTDATAATVGFDATSAITVPAGQPSVAATANDATATVAPTPADVSAATVANDATLTIAVTPADASASVTAYDATASTSSNTNAPAGDAAVTVAANDATISATVTPTDASATVTGQDAQASAGVQAGTTTASAAALDALASVAPAAGAGDVVAAALDAQAAVAVNAASASAGATAFDATASTSSNVSAAAQDAAATASAADASVTITVSPADASASVTAFDATVSTQVATNANAGQASATAAAFDASVHINVNALAAAVSVTAYGAGGDNGVRDFVELDASSGYTITGDSSTTADSGTVDSFTQTSYGVIE